MKQGWEIKELSGIFNNQGYIGTGVEELDQDQIPSLLTNKYQSLPDAGNILGDLTKVKDLFIGFKKYLYEGRVA